jgi:hypothetical protein
MPFSSLTAELAATAVGKDGNDSSYCRPIVEDYVEDDTEILTRGQVPSILDGYLPE